MSGREGFFWGGLSPSPWQDSPHSCLHEGNGVILLSWPTEDPICFHGLSADGVFPGALMDNF